VPLSDIFGLASPYRLYSATVQDSMWQLDGLPSIAVPGISVFDHVDPSTISIAGMPSTAELIQELGEPSSKKKDANLKNFGHWDGSEWWIYEAKGVEFKVRPVLQKDGQPREIIEKVALNSPEGGLVAGIKVGDSEKHLMDSLGKGDVRGSFLREDVGFRSYIGGGVAFLTDVQTGQISRIELRRPLSFLKAGLIPGKLQEGDFARIADIDYESAEVTLEIPDQAKVAEGSRFLLRNLDGDAFAPTPNSGQIVAEATQLKSGFVTCRLSLLSGNGLKPLGLTEARKSVLQLLDPTCGFSYGIQLDR
jgi:hypothetical protein